MDKERWKKIEALFHAALERPEDERLEYVRAACDGDVAMYDEVVSLIDSDSRDLSLLDGRAVDALADDAAAEAAAGLEGQRVGPYRIVERIGAGGMGSVYLAERADGQFEQRVALKVIKRGMDTDEILARFRAERQILAQLQHPNIARLIDGGVTEDGRPYFTMEYVDGEPIDRYCDDKSLTVDERLELFETVCKVVQYAQHNLVVHRDLKPSNIIVTKDGEVKLLDFGIAKVVGEEADLRAGTPIGLTRTGARIMTPGYASPEQVRGEPVTTATDVYSLGVVLFELLTGHRPYLAAAPGELERAIVETPPQRPSTVVTTTSERVDSERRAVVSTTPEMVAASRGTVPDQLRRRLSGDLDNICLMALRKEPDRRYASADLLLQDIERHRAGRPVAARKDTYGYRAQKFVRRNRTAVVSLGIVALAIVALTAFYTSRLARERDRARVEAAKAAEVSEFMQSLFEVADPGESRGQSVTARELLDAGADRVEKELAGQPEVQATMMSVIAKVYHTLGLYERALALHERSLEILRDLHGEEHRSIALTLNWIGDVQRDMGNYQKARTSLEQSLEMLRRTTHPDDPEIGNVLNSLAWVLDDLGDYDRAERLFREAIDLFTRTVGETYPTASVAMNNLALVLHEQGTHEEAERLFRRALAIQREVFGDVHPEVATTLYNLGQLLRDMGDFDAAEKVQREGLEMDRALYGDEHPELAYSLNSLSILLRRLGKFDEAEELAVEALEMRRRLIGDEHPDYAYSLSALGLVLAEKREFERAEQLYNESLAIHRKVNGERHPAVGHRLNNLGRLYFDWGRYPESERFHREALAILEEGRGGDIPAVAGSLMWLGRPVAAQGRLEEAIALERRALEIALKKRGKESPIYISGVGELGSVLTMSAQFEEAEQLTRESLALARALYGDDDLRTASAMCRVAAVMRETGRTDSAREYYSVALETRRNRLPEGDPRIAETQRALDSCDD